jgi:hypothetical protein
MNSDMQNSLIEAYKTTPIINSDVSTIANFVAKPKIWRDKQGRDITQFAYEQQQKAGNDMG